MWNFIKSIEWRRFVTRKVIGGAGTAGLIAGCWVATHWLKGAAEHYNTLTLGLTGVYATFCGANTVQDHLLKGKKDLPEEP